MSMLLKKVFKVKTEVLENGKTVEKEIELAVRHPTPDEQQKARFIFAKVWHEAVDAGAMMREALDRYLRDQKLWDDQREKEYDFLRKSILDGERRIKMGGNANLTKKQGRDLALQVRDWRSDLQDLLTERNRVDANTADALADNAQFNFLVASCTVYNDTNKPYFATPLGTASVDVYMEKGKEEVAAAAASNFYFLRNPQPEESTDSVEDKFLKDFGFADKNGHLVDKQGRLVDRKGRLVKIVDGVERYINEAGDFVDAEGNPVDEKGQYIVEFAPFLDDDDDEEKAVAAPAYENKAEVKTEEPAQPDKA